MTAKSNAKYFLISLLLLSLMSRLFSQTLPDSVIKKYNSAKTHMQKAVHLSRYAFSFAENAELWNKKTNEMHAYFETNKDKLGIAYTELIKANIWNIKKDFTNILRYQIPLIEKFKELQDTTGLIWIYSSIGLTYEMSHNFVESTNYAKLLSAIYISQKNKPEVARNYNWISSVYARAFIPDSGLCYAQKALILAKELKDDTILTVTLSDIGENYIADKKYESALPYLWETIKCGEATYLHMAGWAYVYNDFAQAYLGLHKYDSISYYAHRSLKISILIVDKEQELRSYQYLYKSFDETKQLDSSNKYFRLAANIKDSMYSDEKIKAIEAIGFKEHLHQLQLENEKVQIEQDAEKERQKIITYSIGAVLLLVALFAGFIFRSLRIARKQKKIIEEKNKETEEQKEIIEEKNKAVMDSIRYASRIQRALITSENYIAIQLNRLKKN